jgi:hypothetical protein
VNSKEISEALGILTEFDFSNHYLLHYLLEFVVPYLHHYSRDVRIKCAEATCKLLMRKEQSPPTDDEYGMIVCEILQRLLVGM